MTLSKKRKETSIEEYKKIILEIMMENPKKLWKKDEVLREAETRSHRR